MDYWIPILNSIQAGGHNAQCTMHNAPPPTKVFALLCSNSSQYADKTFGL